MRGVAGRDAQQPVTGGVSAVDTIISGTFMARFSHNQIRAQTNNGFWYSIIL